VTTQKVLVIDDSKVIRMRVKDMLPPGFEVIEAKDGLDGWNKIQEIHPNLIMLDFLLPRMSGWEVYQAVQQEYKLKTIPLVLMSGRKEEVTEKLPEPFQYFSFVEKPFEKKQLVDAIRDAIAKSKKHPRPTGAPTTTTGITGSGDISAMEGEIHKLHVQVAKMQHEIDGLKKQLTQLVGFIKQKLK
jgi:CheY-like chemotaxis protein